MGNIILVAASLNNIIGLNNKLPWKLPSEMRHFKETTLNKMIVVGRKTFDSMGLLRSRINVVLTSEVRSGQIILNDNLVKISSIEDIFSLKKVLGYEEDVYVIGGAEVYKLFLRETGYNKIEKILLSRIPIECEGDAYFPRIPCSFKLSSIIEKEDFNIEEYINEST